MNQLMFVLNTIMATVEAEIEAGLEDNSKLEYEVIGTIHKEEETE